MKAKRRRGASDAQVTGFAGTASDRETRALVRKQGSGCTVAVNSAVLPGDVIPRAERNKNAKPFCQVNDGKASKRL